MSAPRITAVRDFFGFFAGPGFLPILLAAAMCAAGRDALASSGANTFLPFDDNFEAYANGAPLNAGANGWHGSSGNIVVVSDTNLAPAGSINLAMIPVDCTLSNRFAGIPSANVWIQMDMRPSLYDSTNPPAVDTNVAVMFYVNSNGNIVVHNGPAAPGAAKSANWVTLTNFNFGTHGARWVTIGIYEDFNTRIWHLYASNKLVTNNIKFINQGLASFSGLDIYNGAATTYLDNVSVAISNRPVLTVAGSFTVSNKVYDASTTAAIRDNRLALLGAHAGADVKLMAGAVFADKHVGAGKSVSLARSRLAGADAANYTLSLAGAPAARGDITKAEALTVTAVNNVKVYDGTTSATGMPMITGGSLVGGDTAAWSQVYNNKDAGTGKALVPSGTVSEGADVSHYKRGVTFVTIFTGVIARQPLAASLVSTISKVYDGNAAATLAATNYALSGLVGSETSTINQAVGAYATTAVGTGILVTATLAPANFSGGLGGFLTNNYTLPAGAEGYIGEITKAPATVTLYDLVQKYNGKSRVVTNTTVPAGLTVGITYNGSIWEPVNAGSYAVTGMVYDATYQGMSTGTLTISK